MQASDIEKKSLETHVELCAERYKFLEQKLETVEEKVIGLETVIREVHDTLMNMASKSNDRLINWGVGIIVTLIGIVGYLLATFVFK